MREIVRHSLVKMMVGTPSYENDAVSGTGGHEMVFLAETVENQDSQKRGSGGRRSIVSTISLEPRGA